MDTIVYSLHNLEKYPILIDYVKVLKKAKAVCQVDVTNTDDIIQELKQTNTFSKLFETAYINFMTDKIWFVTFNAKAEIESSAYGINISYNEINDYLKFEFSIPKFFYSNNVIDLLPPISTKYNAYPNDIKEIAKFWFNIIQTLLPSIIEQITFYQSEKIDLSDVSIQRTDIAFNQIHKNFENVTYYLEAQKRLKPKMIDEHSLNREKNGIWFNSSTGYHFKIYAKGPEFEKKGSPQIYKAIKDCEKNKKGVPESLARSYENIFELQEYANQILRYEFEAKQKYYSYLFDKYFKKRNHPDYHKVRADVERCTKFPEDYEILTQVKFKFLTIDGTFTFKRPSKYIDVYFYLPVQTGKNDYEIQQITEPKKIERIKSILNAFQRLKKYGIVDFERLKIAKGFFEKEQNKVHQFYLRLKKEDYQPDGFSGPGSKFLNDRLRFQETNTNQLFTFELFLKAIEKFQQLFKNFQLEQLPTLQNIEKLARQRNKMIDAGTWLNKDGSKPKKYNPNALKLWVALLKNQTINEVGREKILARNTIWRKKKQFEELLNYDINTNYIESDQFENLVKDAQNLYSQHNFNRITGNNIISIFTEYCSDLLLMS